MKNWHLCALLAVAVPSMAAAAGDEIELVSMGATSTLAVGDSFASTNFNGWNITATGSSGAPGLFPSGISLQVNATCLTGNCLTNALDVFFTSTNFSSALLPAGGFATNYTASETAGETTRAITWADGTNGEFGGGFPTGVGADHTGTVTLNASGSGSMIGSPTAGLPNPNYSLTIEEAFTDTTGTVAAFTASGNMTAAPEIDPASAMGGLTLLAGGLAVLRGRRRKP